MTPNQRSGSRLVRATESIKLMQTTTEPVSGNSPDLTSDEWNLITLLVLRHAIRRGGQSNPVLRGLVCKLLRDRDTTIALGGER